MAYSLHRIPLSIRTQQSIRPYQPLKAEHGDKDLFFRLFMVASMMKTTQNSNPRFIITVIFRRIYDFISTN
jgi:hypothetical protein